MTMQQVVKMNTDDADDANHFVENTLYVNDKGQVIAINLAADGSTRFESETGYAIEDGNLVKLAEKAGDPSTIILAQENFSIDKNGFLGFESEKIKDKDGEEIDNPKAVTFTFDPQVVDETNSDGDDVQVLKANLDITQTDAAKKMIADLAIAAKDAAAQKFVGDNAKAKVKADFINKTQKAITQHKDDDADPKVPEKTENRTYTINYTIDNESDSKNLFVHFKVNEQDPNDDTKTIPVQKEEDTGCSIDKKGNIVDNSGNIVIPADQFAIHSKFGLATFPQFFEITFDKDGAFEAVRLGKAPRDFNKMPDDANKDWVNVVLPENAVGTDNKEAAENRTTIQAALTLYKTHLMNLHDMLNEAKADTISDTVGKIRQHDFSKALGTAPQLVGNKDSSGKTLYVAEGAALQELQNAYVDLTTRAQSVANKFAAVDSVKRNEVTKDNASDFMKKSANDLSALAARSEAAVKALGDFAENATMTDLYPALTKAAGETASDSKKTALKSITTFVANRLSSNTKKTWKIGDVECVSFAKQASDKESAEKTYAKEHKYKAALYSPVSTVSGMFAAAPGPLGEPVTNVTLATQKAFLDSVITALQGIELPKSDMVESRLKAVGSGDKVENNQDRRHAEKYCKVLLDQLEAIQKTAETYKGEGKLHQYDFMSAAATAITAHLNMASVSSASYLLGKVSSGVSEIATEVAGKKTGYLVRVADAVRGVIISSPAFKDLAKESQSAVGTKVEAKAKAKAQLPTFPANGTKVNGDPKDAKAKPFFANDDAYVQNVKELASTFMQIRLAANRHNDVAEVEAAKKANTGSSFLPKMLSGNK